MSSGTELYCGFLFGLFLDMQQQNEEEELLWGFLPFLGWESAALLSMLFPFSIVMSLLLRRIIL